MRYADAVSVPTAPAPTQRGHRLLPIAAIVALLLVAAARITGPSDLWDQTQPRTVAYTADMIERGGDAWILARDASGLHATKPPLYNWLAAPGVALLGRSSELAHRLPSLLALAAIVVGLVRVGERHGRGVGWLAALAYVSMFPAIKLGYLARPDMLLCLVMFLGWRAANAALLDPARPARHRDTIVYWLAVALAAWTKGPVALCLVAYPAALTLVVHRSLRPLGRLRPFTLGLVGSALSLGWYGLAAWIDPEHFRQTLVYGEVVGRMTGNGPEGGGEGPLRIVLDFPVMTLYFFARFAPWSLMSLLGAMALVGREPEGPSRGTQRWRLSPSHAELLGAVLWTAIIVLLFSFSSGKRADYIAPVYAPAAIVAAWWMLRDPHSPIRTRPWIAAAIAAAGIALHVAVDRSGTVVSRATMDHIASITERALAEKARAGVPLVVIAPQVPHIAVLAGDPAPSDNSAKGLRSLLKERETALVLVGTGQLPQPLRGMVESGRARELWSMPFPEDAAKADMTSPLALYEIRPPAAPTNR